MTLRKGYITGLYRQVCSEVNTRMNICFAVPKPISSYQYFRSSLSPNEVRQNRFYESKQPVDSCWENVGIVLALLPFVGAVLIRSVGLIILTGIATSLLIYGF